MTTDSMIDRLELELFLHEPLVELKSRVAARSIPICESSWPGELLEHFCQCGITRWFVGEAWGGSALSTAEVAGAYVGLASIDLNSTFIYTQRSAASKRLESSQNQELKEHWLPQIADGTANCTVGISHLTTSGRHLKPAMIAKEQEDGFLLNGVTPWVTGADHVNLLVIGATLGDGREILLAVERDRFGIEIEKPVELVALTGSCTGRVRFDDVQVPKSNLIAGPVENVMAQGSGGGTGGIQTSALAIGLAAAAIEYMQVELTNRPTLKTTVELFEAQWETTYRQLIDVSNGSESASAENLRQSANSLALRSTQAALGIAKGAGFIASHPVGRWCRQALFFLVWSCPETVLQANLCELAMITN